MKVKAKQTNVTSAPEGTESGARLQANLLCNFFFSFRPKNKANKKVNPYLNVPFKFNSLS